MFVIVKNKPNSAVSEVASDAAYFDCTSAPGCCLAMSLDVFESVGGFDPTFFVYFEDTDLCKRLRDAGERVRIYTDLRIRHAGSSTSGGTGSYMHYYLYSQGKRIYIRKHFGAPMFYLYFTALVASLIRVALGRLSMSQYFASLRGFATPTGK
jgi:GT2 family glycosyltransferase